MAGAGKNSLSLHSLLHDFCLVPAGLDCTVFGLSLDSRKVQRGDLFIALKGLRLDASKFIEDAVEKGAVAVLLETESDRCVVGESRGVVVVELPDLKSCLGTIASRFYSEPSKELAVIGVTGTNGKTSVSHYIASVLTELGGRCGVIGTLGNGIFGQSLTDTGHTTPDVITLHRCLKDLGGMGAKSAAVEASSHGLDQGRLDGVAFNGAVFTNLSRDHLDYHETMDEYGAAKKKLFEFEGLKFAVVNVDDAFAGTLLDAMPDQVDVLTYSVARDVDRVADISVEKVEYSKQGIAASVKGPWGYVDIDLALVGVFNLSNILAVMAVAWRLGYCKEEITVAVSKVRPVAGRMQLFVKTGFPDVVVDYAHTPDALESALNATAPHCQGDIWCVFGCGGDRDVGKRAEMGEVAERRANKVVITDDNPRTENPKDIVDKILSGMHTPENAVVKHNRYQAIEFAINSAAEDDLILIAGKGHEDYQLIGDRCLPFSDIDVVEGLMEAIHD